MGPIAGTQDGDGVQGDVRVVEHVVDVGGVLRAADERG